MSTIRQYFDTDFDHVLRVNITYPPATMSGEAAILVHSASENATVNGGYRATKKVPDGLTKLVIVSETLLYSNSRVV